MIDCHTRRKKNFRIAFSVCQTAESIQCLTLPMCGLQRLISDTVLNS